MSDELKLCPFCGSEKVWIYKDTDVRKRPMCGWYVSCQTCSADGPWSSSVREAIEKWNKR